jgi:transposase
MVVGKTCWLITSGVGLLDDGMSCEAIAKVLLLDDDTIRTWYRLYEEDGIEGLTNFSYEGSACQLSGERQEKLKAWVATALPRTTRQVGAWIENEFGIVYEGRVEKERLADELKRTAAEIHRIENSAANRVAALEAIHTAALAESENEAQAKIRSLRDQLVDAEATLAKARNNKRNRPAWMRLLSRSRRRAERELVNSGLFDAEWYMREYPDVADSAHSPAGHYLEEGYLHGYRPNPLFDTRWYFERYEDVRSAGVNPLLHYLQSGYKEGRDPGPEFETDFYLMTYPDVRLSGMNPLGHYLLHGRHEGRLPIKPRGGG